MRSMLPTSGTPRTLAGTTRPPTPRPPDPPASWAVAGGPGCLHSLRTVPLPGLPARLAALPPLRACHLFRRGLAGPLAWFLAPGSELDGSTFHHEGPGRSEAQQSGHVSARSCSHARFLLVTGRPGPASRHPGAPSRGVVEKSGAGRPGLAPSRPAPTRGRRCAPASCHAETFLLGCTVPGGRGWGRTEGLQSKPAREVSSSRAVVVLPSGLFL